VGEDQGVDWSLVTDDLKGALAVLRPTYDRSGGADGFVSVELAPALAHDTQASVAAARALHRRLAEPNLLVKIPATAEGVRTIREATAEGLSINVTLLFGLDRYEQVIEAHLQGLEAHDGDLSAVHSVASFFVSRVDTEVDRRLEAIGTPAALALRGRAALAQAKLAYRLFRDRFSGPRWQALAARGARVQGPLWASTSTKNPAYAETLYVDGLIGPDTITTLPEAIIAAFEDHGTLATTITDGVQDAEATLERLAEVGIDLGQVAGLLEDEGVAEGGPRSPAPTTDCCRCCRPERIGVRGMSASTLDPPGAVQPTAPAQPALAGPDQGAYPPIADYALLSDCHSAALVSRDGSIDWCCFHRFDARPVFARLLDWSGGGHFRIAPPGPNPGRHLGHSLRS
jgi:transaldolase